MKIHKYTKEQHEFMFEFVPGHSHKEIAEAFNKKFDSDITLSNVKSYIGNNKLNTGRTGRFEKGHVPFNKGKKGLTTGGVETQFKKGNIPHNHREVGTEVINGDGYWQVKIAEPNVWKLKHRLVWEQVNGPIPEGHIVIFADQDRENFEPDNLLLISRQKFIRMNQNGLIKNNKEATKTGAVIADLIMTASKAKKKMKSK